MEETFDKELVKKKYPFPIATYYAKMQKEEKCMQRLFQDENLLEFIQTET